MKKRFRYPTSFGSKKYPEHIRKEILFRSFKKPAKIFPRIGLPNCKENVKSIIFSKNSNCYLEFLSDKILIVLEKISYYKKFEKLRFLRRDLEDLITILNRDSDRCNFNFRDYNFDVLKSKTLPELVSEINKYFNKNGANILKIKINNLLATDLLRNKNLKVSFSSNKPRGYWDIATMSMRGVSSCMHWDHGRSTSLIGSILDPYMGIIYLTNGKMTKNGEKILARAIVRFTVDSKNRPSLYIDTIYKTDRYDEQIILGVFEAFIQKRVKNIEIVSQNEIYPIPLSRPIDKLIKNKLETDEPFASDDFLSYRDNDHQYKMIKKFYNPNKIPLKLLKS